MAAELFEASAGYQLPEISDMATRKGRDLRGPSFPNAHRELDRIGHASYPVLVIKPNLYHHQVLGRPSNLYLVGGLEHEFYFP